MATIWFLSLLFVTILLLAAFKRKKQQRRPPSPPGLPIIGNLHQLGELPHQSLWKLSKEYGPVMFLKLGSIPTVVLSSSETAKQALKIHDLHCCSRPSLAGTMTLTQHILQKFSLFTYRIISQGQESSLTIICTLLLLPMMITGKKLRNCVCKKSLVLNEFTRCNPSGTRKSRS